MTVGELLSILFIAVSLSADCFAVALGGGVSLNKLRTIQIWRTALAFGIAQIIMPVIGWAVGRTVIDLISGYDHWVAFGLLAIVGGRMLWEAFHEKPGGERLKEGADFTRGFLLFTMSIATSIDALMVGLSLAFLQTAIIEAILIIGVMTFSLSLLGFLFGCGLGQVFGNKVRIIGGLILLAIGVQILVEHLA